MKIINVNLGKDLKELRIIPISDVHIGDKLTNYKILKEVLETIRDTRINLYQQRVLFIFQIMETIH